MPDTVEIRNVTKQFGDLTAVDDLSLNVPEGSIYGFIGPNGSGKTTTLRMIMNIFYPDSGTIRLFGEEMVGTRSARIGYLPEERGMYKKMKVRDLLSFYGEIKGGRKVDAAIDTWLDKLNLAEWADKKVETLSKGMSQKIQFISTVLTSPDLVILDEPFSGLDPVNLDLLRKIILELQSDGHTVIFSTHDMAVAENLCDFIFMIHNGQKVLDGTLDEIQDQFGHDTIRVSCADGKSLLRKLKGVDHVSDFGQYQELRLIPGGDPQKVLAQIVAQTEVYRYEIAKPSLHDIFVRIAAPEAVEVNHE